MPVGRTLVPKFVLNDFQSESHVSVENNQKTVQIFPCPETLLSWKRHDM